MTPRQRALRVTLKWFCMGECESNDGLLCRWHADIEKAIQEAVAEVLGGGNTMMVQVKPDLGDHHFIG